MAVHENSVENSHGLAINHGHTFHQTAHSSQHQITLPISEIICIKE